MAALQQDAINHAVHANLADHFLWKALHILMCTLIVLPQDVDFVNEFVLLSHARQIDAMQG